MQNNNQKNVVVTYNSPFLNTDCIFIEYDDVIKSPFFIFLLAVTVKDNDTLKIIFDLSEIENMDVDELYLWYINRKYKNIFECLPLQENVMEIYFENDENKFHEWCEVTLYDIINTNEYLVNHDVDLNFAHSLDILIKKTLVGKYYIYSPIYSRTIENDIIKRYGNKITYVSGDLNEVLIKNNITSNSTFVFSDIRNIKALEECKLLNYSSVIIADKYQYNYKDDANLVIDIDHYSSSFLFKLDFFDNLHDYE